MTTFTARTPLDVAAAVPIAFGFVPENSIAMLTWGGMSFQARIDLPETDEDILRAVSALLEPAKKHGITRVMFAAYAADKAQAWKALNAMETYFLAATIDVLDPIHVDGNVVYVKEGEDGQILDLASHPLTAQAVAAGRLVLNNRSALADAITPGKPITPADVKPHPTWLAETMRELIESRTMPDPHTTSILLAGLAQPDDRRDALMLSMDRTNARDAVDVFAYLARCSQGATRVAAVTLTGMAAWVSGDGALAWVCHDAATAIDPDYTLTHLLRDVLDRAVPPTMWDDFKDMA